MEFNDAKRVLVLEEYDVMLSSSVYEEFLKYLLDLTFAGFHILAVCRKSWIDCSWK